MGTDQFKALADACMDRVAKGLAELRLAERRMKDEGFARAVEFEARIVALEDAVKPRHRVQAGSRAVE